MKNSLRNNITFVFGIIAAQILSAFDVNEIQKLDQQLHHSIESFYSKLSEGNIAFKGFALGESHAFDSREGVVHSFRIGNKRIRERYALWHGTLLYTDPDNFDMVWRVDMFTDLWLYTKQGWKVIPVPRTELEIGVDESWLNEVREIANKVSAEK